MSPFLEDETGSAYRAVKGLNLSTSLSVSFFFPSCLAFRLLPHVINFGRYVRRRMPYLFSFSYIYGLLCSHLFTPIYYCELINIYILRYLCVLLCLSLSISLSIYVCITHTLSLSLSLSFSYSLPCLSSLPFSLYSFLFHFRYFFPP